MNTIQQMWDATISYFKEGDSDTLAMTKVYTRMQDPLTNQDISDVFSAVYATTYWNVICMDCEKLSRSLMSVIGLTTREAEVIAEKSLSQWRGIYIRDNNGDTGHIPKKMASPYNSIDIVCNGNIAIQPSLLIQKWDTRIWQTPKVGKNYVYTRCQNLGFFGNLSSVDLKYPVVKMFVTDIGFNLPPTSWIQLPTVSNKAKTTGEVVLINGVPGPMNEGTIGCSEAFFFSPTSTDPVCIIGTIGTAFFTNTLHNLGSNWNTATWITHNGAVAIHNAGPFPRQGKEVRLKFYNQDDTSENFAFKIYCRNVPVGLKIILKCENKKIRLNSGLITVIKPSFEFVLPVTLPANYKGELIVSMENPGNKKLPDNASVQIDMVWNLTKGHKQFPIAMALYNAHKKSNNFEDHDLIVGSYTLTGKEDYSE